MWRSIEHFVKKIMTIARVVFKKKILNKLPKKLENFQKFAILAVVDLKRKLF